MVTSVTELITEKTESTILTELLAAAAALDLPTTSWQSGSVPRVLLQCDARALADLRASVRSIALGAYLDDAEGGWLDILALGKYGVSRVLATFTEGYVRLTASASAGPYTIGAAALVVSDGTLRYRSTNTASLTLSAGGTLDVPVRAESPGADYNVSTINTLVSPALAGVTVTSPAYGGGATWRTADGTDDESDESVRVRCRARWGTLGRGANELAYIYLATTCPDAPAITRAKVVWGIGDGTVQVYIATSSGPASPSEVAAVKAYLDANAPGTDTPEVDAAAAVAIALTIAIATTDTSSANEDVIDDALQALQASLGIGDDVDLGAIYHACYAGTGIRDVDITTSAALDAAIGASEIASLSWTITLSAP